jgi:hypothetical protein
MKIAVAVDSRFSKVTGLVSGAVFVAGWESKHRDHRGGTETTERTF